MPSVAPVLAPDHANDPPLYSKAELIELRRNILLYARSFPPGFERNQHRQIALSLGRLFHNKKWLDAHTLEGVPSVNNGTSMSETHCTRPSFTEQDAA
jgi:hypothetical protein